MTFGIIDIGSNTIRMNVYKLNGDDFTPLFSQSEAAGLVSYIENGTMNEEGITRLADTLKKFQSILSLLGTDSYAAFATASLRGLTNTDEVLSEVEARTGIRIDLLPGTDEASLSFQGALHGIVCEEGVYIDTGGGSTEVVIFDHGQVRYAASMPIGSLNLYNSYVIGLIPTREEIEAMEKRVTREFQAVEPDGKPIAASVLVVTGGSFRAVRALLEDLGRIEPGQMEVDPALLAGLLETILEDPNAAIHRILKVNASRLHTLMPGLVIVSTIAKTIHAAQIQVSLRGVREGYLLKHGPHSEGSAKV